jgi:hypothetical protein
MMRAMMVTVLTVLTVLTVGAGVPSPWIGIQAEWLMAPGQEAERWGFIAEADTMGITEVAFSLAGGDVAGTDILTWNEAQRNDLRQTATAMNSLGILPNAMVWELEKRGIEGDFQLLTRIDVATSTLAGTSYALMLEEYWAGLNTALMAGRRIRQNDPNALILWSNPHYGPPRWEFETIILPALMAEGLIDGWLIQDDSRAIDATLTRARDLGVFAVAWEQAPADYGTQPQDVLEWFKDGRAASIYPGYKNPACTDLRCPQPGIYAQPLAQLGRERFLRHAGTGGDFNGDGRIDAADFWR